MILHIDMDAFYASIEQRDRPELRGQPVVVGGSSARGVVAAASYEARRFGIHSAMPGRRAAELCPDAVFVKGRIDHYATVGRQVREIFGRYTPLVQPLSLDEAFLDVTGSRRLFGSAEKIGREIKLAIRQELGLTASVGIAPLKFVAKIASDLRKPDGFVEVADGDVQSFLDPLPVTRLWGVGRVGQQKLHRKGIFKVVDLRRRELHELKQSFGSWGEHLWNLANGIDARAVVPDRTAKQIGHERTFHDDLTDPEMIRAVVSYLTEAVAQRLRNGGRHCRCVSIKYRRDDFRTYARSFTLPRPTDSTDRIFRAAIELLDQMRKAQPRPVRLIGVSLGSLTERGAPTQMSLFELAENESSQKEVDKVVDGLRKAIGETAVYRATSHDWIHRKS
jgi:DNA polymerase-4